MDEDKLIKEAVCSIESAETLLEYNTAAKIADRPIITGKEFRSIRRKKNREIK